MKTNSGLAFRRNGRMAAAFLFLMLLPLSCVLGEQAKEKDNLESVLKTMGTASRTFKSYEAKAVLKNFDSLMGESTTEEGEFYYKRAKDGSSLIRLEIEKPGKKITTISEDGVVLIYQPDIKNASRYNLGKKEDSVEYMALGFGRSPEKLKDAYDISYLGRETVGGKACSILELKPKAAGSMFSSITLWIDDKTGISRQMKMSEEYGNYLLMEFSNEELNGEIDNSKFTQKLPKDVDLIQLN